MPALCEDKKNLYDTCTFLQEVKLYITHTFKVCLNKCKASSGICSNFCFRFSINAILINSYEFYAK